MELWEFNACVQAHNERQRSIVKEQLFTAWHTAAWTGAAFAGKLRAFSHYVKGEADKRAAPQISKAEFDERLRLAEQGGQPNGSEGP